MLRNYTHIEKLFKYLRLRISFHSATSTNWRGQIVRGKHLLNVRTNFLQTHKMNFNLITSLGPLHGEFTAKLSTTHQMGVSHPLFAENSIVSITHEKEGGMVGSKGVPHLF